jgi:hypothetical protein
MLAQLLDIGLELTNLFFKVNIVLVVGRGFSGCCGHDKTPWWLM